MFGRDLKWQAKHMQLTPANIHERIAIMEREDIDAALSLDLSENQLEYLPHNIRKLVNLRVLFLEGNQLEMLPHWLAELPQLQRICLQRNESLRRCWFPASLCDAGRRGLVIEVAREHSHNGHVTDIVVDEHLLTPITYNVDTPWGSWSRANHYLFPANVQQRIMMVLWMINGVHQATICLLRAQKDVVWNKIIPYVATLDAATKTKK